MAHGWQLRAFVVFDEIEMSDLRHLAPVQTQSVDKFLSNAFSSFWNRAPVIRERASRTGERPFDVNSGSVMRLDSKST